MFIIINVRFFIIYFINGWKYEEVGHKLVRLSHVLFVYFKNIQNPNLYFLNSPRYHPYEPPSDSCITCVFDILECATFKCWRTSTNRTPILKTYPAHRTSDWTSNSSVACLPILSYAIVLHLCILWIYKTRVPITGIPQFLALAFPRETERQLFSKYH